MENNNQRPANPENEDWLQELMKEVEIPTGIRPDNPSVPHKSSSPNELDLDSILSENWDSDDSAPQADVMDHPAAEEPVSDRTTVFAPQPDREESSGSKWDNYVWKHQNSMGRDAKSRPAPEDTPEMPPLSNAKVRSHPDVPVSEEGNGKNEKKGRPKLKKGYGLLGIPHIAATAVWIGIILAIGISLGRVLWVCTADLMAFGKPDHEVVITIVNGDNIDTVAQKLADADLIRYPGLFKTFATVTGKDDRISVGTFTLNSKFDYNAMINAMGSYAPAREEVEVVIPEGYNCAQLFQLLEDKKVCSVKDLEQWAREGELKDYWFLKNVKRDDKYCLEGFLAPDTYKFYTNDEPERVLEKMLNEFDDRFTDKMRDKYEILQERYANALYANGLDEAYVQAHPLTLNSILTLASIIDRETSSGDESYEIASVFFNRLTNPNQYPHLESKATLRYAVGDYFGEIIQFSDAHMATDSPYNTFVCEGLPVGPICNPGVNSIYAALDPNETNYYYYVYDQKENHHRFASTYDGHMQNVAKVEANG